MTNEDLPFVSFLIPTYNEEKNIAKCLQSIISQEYPTDKLEILVIDGMSSDETVEIAKKYPVRIICNPKRIIPEACNLGVTNARGELLSFLGADSELPQKNWVKLMVAPLMNDKNVAGSNPILTPNRKYPAISRFFSLMQADPIIIFAYGSGLDIEGGYITEHNYFPMGIHIIRKSLLVGDFGFKSELTRSEDVDLTYRLVKNGYRFAIVKEAGLYHLYIDSYSRFLKKTRSRIAGFVKTSLFCGFTYIPKNQKKSKFLKNLLYDTIGIGILKRVVKGIHKDRDFAWLYYPIVLLSTLFIYTIVFATTKEGRKTFIGFISNSKKSTRVPSSVPIAS